MSEHPNVIAFREKHPELEYVEAFITDVNGIARGKRLPASALGHVFEQGLNLPASTLLLDIWGDEVPATGLIFDTGDADHPCRPVANALQPLPGSTGRGGQLMLSMATPEGSPFHADPRNALQRVQQRLAQHGLSPVVATELEFRLFDAAVDTGGRPQPPAQLLGHTPSQLLGLDELGVLSELFTEIDEACRALGLPTDTILAEQSAGQYEVNLRHVADPVLAADHAVTLKRTLKAIARRHDMVASFMAKPVGDEAGNGLHVHTSLLDRDGHNALAGDNSEYLRQALGGLSATMPEAMLLFAPHANSYRRFQPGAHVPIAPNWGHDNRTTALRIPLSSPAATRIEHRVAGADANPYLVVAAVLAGIEQGLRYGLEPPAETQGSAFEQAPTGVLPGTWEAALTAFENSPRMADYLGAGYQRLISACKRQEQTRMRAHVPGIEHRTYLGVV